MTARRVFAIALIMVPLFSRLSAQEYSIDLESDGERLAVIDLAIFDGKAIAKVGDVTEHFDLQNQRWQRTGTEEWVSLEQCEAWAKQSRERSSKSMASIPEKMRLFVAWSLDPTFAVAQNDDVLKLTSGQVDYEIVVVKPDHDLADYYRYAKLNAYKKAMTERKLPPFAELKVLEELERRKVMPKSMDIRIPGIAGAPAFKMNISERLKQPVTKPSPKAGESFSP